MRHNLVTIRDAKCNFMLENVLGQDNVSCTRMIVVSFLVSKLFPFEYFFPDILVCAVTQ